MFCVFGLKAQGSDSLVLQNTYERVSYALTGDTPSPGYFSVDASGRVSLITPLSGVQADYFAVSASIGFGFPPS